MKLSDDPDYMSYKKLKMGIIEPDSSGNYDYNTSMEIINAGKFELFPYCAHALNEMWNPNIPKFFILLFDQIGMRTLKKLIPFLDLSMEFQGKTVIYNLCVYDVKYFKLFFDEFERRNIRINSDILEHYIRKPNSLQIVEFLKGYITVLPKHITIALKCKKNPIWFDVLKTNSRLSPKILSDAVYNPEIFETMLLQLSTGVSINAFKLLFYDSNIVCVDYAVRLLLDNDNVPKPPLGYLSVSNLNIRSYYEQELTIIENMFSERGLGRIVISYIVGL